MHLSLATWSGSARRAWSWHFDTPDALDLGIH